MNVLIAVHVLDDDVLIHEILPLLERALLRRAARVLIEFGKIRLRVLNDRFDISRWKQAWLRLLQRIRQESIRFRAIAIFNFGS